MPARDFYHDDVRNSLVKDGWTITHDPYTMTFEGRDLFVDLGAERLLAAERGTERIAVEVKSFLGPSEMHDLQRAIGQFLLYRTGLARLDPDRALYLAVPKDIARTLLKEPLAETTLAELGIRYLVFDPDSDEVVEWKK
jgi:hypothetical protein